MLTDVFFRLRALFSRGRVERELDEELRFHFDQQVAAHEKDGLNRQEAIRRARLAFGGRDQIKEEYRDALGVRLLDDCVRDVRLGVRSLLAAPLVTLAAVLSLALGIGANTAIFSILDGLILRPLPVRDPASLVHVTDSVRRDTGEIRVRAWSYPVWEQIARNTDLFEAATAWAFTRFSLASGGETQPVDGIWADGSFFDTLGVRAALGRTLSARDDEPGGGPEGAVAVISDGCWKRYFGSSPDVVGRSIRLNGVPFTIVGVTAPGFFGVEVGREFDVVVPVRTEALVRGRDSVLDSASTNFLSILARLKPGQSLDAAIGQLRAVQPQVRAATLEPSMRDQHLASPFTLVPAATGFSNLRSNYRRPVVVLAAIVALVLLIACVNVANLLLARSIARQHELSVRLALGASRTRLVRHLLTESLILAALGAALGIIVASQTSQLLVSQLSTPDNRVVLDVSPDARVLVFAVAAACVTALIFGTVPALRASRTRPMGALTERGHAASRHSGTAVMGGLMVAQVALSVVLVVAAALFLGSFASLATRPIGLDPDPVLVVTVDPQRTGVPPDQRVPLFERVRDAVLMVPGVADAAISRLTPAGGGGFTPAVTVAPASSEGQPGLQQPMSANTDVSGNLISAGWFSTFGTQLIAGRDFAVTDRRGAPRVAIVNAAFARRCCRGASPIGRTITVYPDSPMALAAEIVGVAEDAIYSSPHEPVPPTWYLPIAQFDVPGFPFTTARLSVRTTTGSPELATKSLEAAIVNVDSDLTLTFRPLARQIRASLTRERLMAQLAGCLGVLALLLAGIGLYGVTAYAVSRQRSEIAIRMALGAAPGGVVAMVLRRVARLVFAGVLAGTAISLWTSRFLTGLIYGLTPRDPFALLGGAALLCVLGVFAGWCAARWAARMDPIAVLREV
jgi:predicted permease